MKLVQIWESVDLTVAETIFATFVVALPKPPAVT